MLGPCLQCAGSGMHAPRDLCTLHKADGLWRLEGREYSIEALRSRIRQTWLRQG